MQRDRSSRHHGNQAVGGSTQHRKASVPDKPQNANRHKEKERGKDRSTHEARGVSKNDVTKSRKPKISSNTKENKAAIVKYKCELCFCKWKEKLAEFQIFKYRGLFIDLNIVFYGGLQKLKAGS